MEHCRTYEADTWSDSQKNSHSFVVHGTSLPCPEMPIAGPLLATDESISYFYTLRTWDTTTVWAALYIGGLNELSMDTTYHNSRPHKTHFFNHFDSF